MGAEIARAYCCADQVSELTAMDSNWTELTSPFFNSYRIAPSTPQTAVAVQANIGQASISLDFPMQEA